MNRREILTGGVLLSLGSLTAMADEKPAKKARRPRPARETVWKYVPLDPKIAADRGYGYYPPNGCMYASFKAGMDTYADAIEADNPSLAAVCRQFPFLALRSGKTGCGSMESLCGTINGASMFMGLFINDLAELHQMIQQLAEYVKETELPVYVPAGDKHPNFVTAISHSVTCAENKGAWLAKDPSEAHKQLRQERCMRVTASVIAKAVEMLNEKFKNA
ncbi:MAG: C-GCAxxG-C-C family protein [Planctomycetia bacterium]|nr:C-GCAxxG-C-C family protein [Planctomycetia bacterium]